MSLYVDINKSVQTGDFLIVRSTTIFGFVIRYITSRGLHKAWGNHNAPIYRDPANKTLYILDIAAPLVRKIKLEDYLKHIKESKCKYIIVRPDAYNHSQDIHSAIMKKSIAFLIEGWEKYRGKSYDKISIKHILRVLFSRGAHHKINTKVNIYCTEGTVTPLLQNSFVSWRPDVIAYEEYPMPLHTEHLIRHRRVVYIAGDFAAFTEILGM